MDNKINHAQILELQQAIEQNSNDPALHYELGSYYLVTRDFLQSLASLKQALALAPNHPQILMQLGNAASGLNDEKQAQSYFLASLKQDSNQADVHFNLANSLRKLGELKRAIQHFQIAIKLNNRDADYFNNMGNALRELGQLPEAIQAYQQALAINPNMTHALVHWIHQKQHCADWQGLEPAIEKVCAQLHLAQADNTIALKIPPFAFLAMPNTTPQEQAMCATQWAQSHYQYIAPLDPPPLRDDKTPIRVAYLSSDFRVHPLAYLVTDVIQSHNHAQFEIYGYSQTPSEDSIEQNAIRLACEHWLDISQLSDEDVAKQMREQGIDIVVDLSGYTQNSRSGIVAYRPARKSINWLGFAGTMGELHGKALFDYVIVDQWVNVDGLAEKPMLLPCYQPNNAERPLAKTGTKQSHGLPENAFVFCCFNQSFKITQAVFDSWLTILVRTPNSVLWLLASNPWAMNNLKAYAKKRGIDDKRLVFAPRVPIAEHIARHAHADLVLDTLPYNAHTTASDALWMGVPIITCMGETFASRVTASLLSQYDLEALIVKDLSDYENLACDLAKNPKKLSDIQMYLKAHRDALFNPLVFTQRLEMAYREILKEA